MHKAAWERPVASLCAQQEWEPGCCLRARASENAVSLQMRGFSKAQDTENGHICRSSHAVYKVTSATQGCLSRVCRQRLRGTAVSEIMRKRTKCWWELKQKRGNISDICIQCIYWSVRIRTELFKHGVQYGVNGSHQIWSDITDAMNEAALSSLVRTCH